MMVITLLWRSVRKVPGRHPEGSGRLTMMPFVHAKPLTGWAVLEDLAANSGPISVQYSTTPSNISAGILAMADTGTDRGPWDKVNVLTFDGGGVRGYYSLLLLDKLMECIAEEERRQSGEEAAARGTANSYGAGNHPDGSLSSFSPHPMPQNVIHRSDVPPVHASFLPCHYFDYISGTSTGALISIMLGRFRMSAFDCLGEYERLAGQVFGKPRHIHEMTSLGMLNLTTRNKFATTNLECAIKDLVRRRGEARIYRDSDEMLYGTLRGTCRVMVFIQRTTLSSGGASMAKPYIFRSYDKFGFAPNPDGHSQPARTSDPNEPQQTTQPTTAAVWKLARAATAAQFYFKPLIVAMDDPEIVQNRKQEKEKLASGSILAEYTDAGVSGVNNPSRAVFRELETALSDEKKIETWVSVGTARGTKPDERRLLGFKSKIYAAGDTEEIDATMREVSTLSDPEFKGPFNYYRLNDPEGLHDISMDDWEPYGSGETTLRKMRESFQQYYNSQDVSAYFRRCAAELVAIRRARTRADPSLWERYALGTTYTCCDAHCKYRPDMTWEYRDMFKSHLRNDHHPARDDDIETACRNGTINWEYKARLSEPVTPTARRASTGSSESFVV